MLRAGVVVALFAVSLSSAVAQSPSSLHAPSSVTFGGIKFDFADPARAPTTDQQKRFLAKYRAARATGDQIAISALVHPASTACIVSPMARNYFAARMGKEVDATPLENVRVIFVPVSDDDRDFLQGGSGLQGNADASPALTLPVKPTQLIAVDHTRGEYDAKGVLVKSVGGTIVRELALEGDDLKIVVHCLTAKGEELFAKKAAGRNGSAPAK